MAPIWLLNVLDDSGRVNQYAKHCNVRVLRAIECRCVSHWERMCVQVFFLMGRVHFSQIFQRSLFILRLDFAQSLIPSKLRCKQCSKVNGFKTENLRNDKGNLDYLNWYWELYITIHLRDSCLRPIVNAQFAVMPGLSPRIKLVCNHAKFVDKVPVPGTILKGKDCPKVRISTE